MAGDVPDRLQARWQGSQVAGLERERRAAGDLDGHLALQHVDRLALGRCPRGWALDSGEPGQAGPHPVGVDELVHLAAGNLRIRLPLLGPYVRAEHTRMRLHHYPPACRCRASSIIAPRPWPARGHTTPKDASLRRSE